MTDFTIKQAIPEHLDSDGNTVAESTNEINFKATMDSEGVITFTEVSSGDVWCKQPWNFEDDGTRKPWVDIDEGIAWYKTENQHIGD